MMIIAGLSEGNHYAQVAKDTVESALNIRRSSLTDQCSSINSLTPAQLDQFLSQPGRPPASCITPMIDFLKNTMCSDVCINSPLLANMSSSRRAGGRQLLGGGPPSDPETACEDACFSPFMTGMITVMKTMLLPECKTAFPSSRRLLGGLPDEDSMAALELAFGMMCSKNAAGSYCVTIGEGIKNTNENTTGTLDLNTYFFVILIIGLLIGFLSGSTCLASTSLQNSVSSLGCCWGNMVTLSGINSDNDDFMEKVSKQAAACNIALSTTPCASGAWFHQLPQFKCGVNAGMSVATVESTVSLAGITLAQFRTTANEAAFKKGVATTAGVSKNLVAITESTATARRSGVQVKSTVTLAGDAANSKSTVQSNLQNTATLQSNIQSAALIHQTSSSSNLASATVGASTAVSGSTVTGTANSGSSAGVFRIVQSPVCLIVLVQE